MHTAQDVLEIAEGAWGLIRGGHDDEPRSQPAPAHRPAAEPEAVVTPVHADPAAHADEVMEGQIAHEVVEPAPPAAAGDIDLPVADLASPSPADLASPSPADLEVPPADPSASSEPAGPSASSDPAGPSDVNAPPTPDIATPPPFVPDEQLVEQVADPGAEDGAGAQVRVAEPWDGYRAMTAADITDRLAAATAAEVAAVELYELSGRKRKSVLNAAHRRMKAA